ncbi:HNH endonuclease [[Phormidium] sp. LEGE 05292]|uniref:HNH endonuclease n=1 Tax=[Phormidium] sp. LEGE 05292 TaxID=767427 RepID=UPI001D13B607|nr:HNH endonuclease signature motif containing protein [Phormidium sp. LEGE 05292]
MTRPSIPQNLRQLVAKRADYLCEYCLIAEEDTFLGCQVDHIISVKHGGPSFSSTPFTSVYRIRSRLTDCSPEN